MEDNKRDNQNFDFLDLFKKELMEKIQVLEKGLSKLEYDYVPENVDLLIVTVQAIKEGAYRASFPVIVDLSQAMEDVFSYIKREEQSLAPSHVDCLFQADAVFRSILRQENKKVSAWLVERESYIHRVRKILWDFLEERGITPSDYSEQTENAENEHGLAAEEVREDAVEAKEETAVVVAVTPHTELQEELLLKLTPPDDYASADTQESPPPEAEPETVGEIDAPVVEKAEPETVEEIDVAAAEEAELETVEEIDVPIAEEAEPETVEEIDAPVVEEAEPEIVEEINIPVAEEAEPETVEEIDAPVAGKEEPTTDGETGVSVAAEKIPPEDAAGTEAIPEDDNRDAFLANKPLYSDHLLRLASECLIQTRRFRRQYPIFEEMKGIEPARKTMAVYYSAKGVRQHLEYLTEQLCETILRQNKVSIGPMIHQLSASIFQVTAAWDKKVDFISEGDTVLLDARVLTELSEVLWHFLHAVLIDSAGMPVAEDDDERRNISLGSLRLTAEERMEMVRISLFMENYHLHESWAAQQSDDPSQVSRKEVQKRRDVLRDRVIASGGTMDCVLSEKGTEIVLQLPAFFATIPCLPVQIQGASYALPLAHVEQSLNSAREILSKTNIGYEIIYDGEPTLCIAGEEVFPSSKTDNHHDGDDVTVVILKNGQMKYGFIVDTAMDKESLVLYPLDQRLGSIRGVLGAAMMADGSPTLIVDAHALFDMVKGGTS